MLFNNYSVRGCRQYGEQRDPKCFPGFFCGEKEWHEHGDLLFGLSGFIVTSLLYIYESVQSSFTHQADLEVLCKAAEYVLVWGQVEHLL